MKREERNYIEYIVLKRQNLDTPLCDLAIIVKTKYEHLEMNDIIKIMWDILLLDSFK